MKLGLLSALLLSISPLMATQITLNDAIKTALQNNKKHLISSQDVAMAKAKYQQALSANYPTLDVTAVFNRHDEAFIDHTETSFTLQGLGTLPVSYDHTIMGRDTAFAQAQTQYALYSGGKISALQQQAKEAIKYSQEASKLTDNEIYKNIMRGYSFLLN